ncbi:hypothetical protein [Chloracidobacterium aggregatum]|jgi:hypothetical protein|uniref:Uncharacterized protein n=2 Tax=Chloracidobacterium TaxID=458032 RepID=A0ABX8AYT1_9BACT|nr:hypothetical protein [Chloracidobacterium aggregatum]QUV84651.1 hypothetical protein J8C03_11065 [Chloracidobacterium sp. 2]QUV86848.1 hypothetical protein J8C07_06425 [Chloracidobacterium sp. S]QUV91843.1 hypothetical protein J8C04_05540 [Chloracidobacterium sp. A]QUV92977.1 hypothetical protein J8C05_06190 [Chloracidobacterium sp. N]
MPGGTNEVMRDFFIRVIGNTPEERFIYVIRAQNAKAALNLHINNLGDRPCVVLDGLTGEVLERYKVDSRGR